MVELDFDALLSQNKTTRRLSELDEQLPEVGVLRHLCWLEIHGMINTFSLSPNTLYRAFLVFKIIDVVHKFLVVLSVRKIRGHIMTKMAYLNPYSLEREAPGQFPRVRSDDWLEIEMGEFFNSGLEDEEVQMSVVRLDGCWNTSLIIEGIEVRPKDDN
ncbi:putative F-box protein PP2-B12 [Lotus japonicus]|uniref:putative F-box protein PP2-B12 n=1 Tax=Lotus japonicus TaxID=34305 RepID=UPI00258D8A76|nr:putative F-box protein PP2-B12 [Lotus japonicus]